MDNKENDDDQSEEEGLGECGGEEEEIIKITEKNANSK